MDSPDYLLSLSDDILINEIFPQYSVTYFLHLCRINKRFNNICHNDDLWYYFTQRDFGQNSIPQGLTTWRDIYMFYNDILSDPITAIPYVEDALLKEKFNDYLSEFDQILLNKYKNCIERLPYLQAGGVKTMGYRHKLILFNPITNNFLPRTSLDQVRILGKNENRWRSINKNEARTLDLDAYHQKLN